MTANWLRSYAVVIGNGVTGIAFSSETVAPLQVKFKIEKTALSTPNKATFALYNLAPATEQRLQDENTQVTFLAGYGGLNSLMFTGNVTSFKRTWDDCDTIAEVEAGDGDYDYHKAVMIATLAAGSDHNSVIAAALKTFKRTVYGVVNVTPQTTLGGAAVAVANTLATRLRGKSVCASTREVLNATTQDLNAHWSIQDGKLVVIGVDSAKPTPVIPLISAETGLEGYPEITAKGTVLKMRLFPNLEIGGLLNLQSKEAIAKKSKSASKKKTIPRSAFRQSPDGIYKINTIKHEGDFRGDPWTTTVECTRFGA